MADVYDFTDLNKAYPKDSYSLSRIDEKVDAMVGHELLTFMDAGFSGYNQICMMPEDEEKTSFIINRGLFYYKMILFGLKNVGAIYQRSVNKIFKDQICCNKVYVDDMLVKNHSSRSHVDDLETFAILCKYQMKLNLAKCVFEVTSRKFLDS